MQEKICQLFNRQAINTLNKEVKNLIKPSNPVMKMGK
jgi:hypothetical protein